MTKYELKVDGKPVYSFESDQTPVIEAVHNDPVIGAIYHPLDGSGRQVRVVGYNYCGEVLFVESSVVTAIPPNMHAVDRFDFSRDYQYVRPVASRRFEITRLTP